MPVVLALQRETAVPRVGVRPWRASVCLWWACLAGLFAWLFADALFAANNFVYRDAAHFYYPLFKHLASQWADGRVPLWDPYENLGTPLVAQGTSSVFYPGKLLFALPIGFDAAFKAYVLGHLLLAALLVWRLARRWGASVEAAALCGLSYAFGGNVLFQYCNVVFLVGAAWLPLAVGQLDCLLAGRRWMTVAPLGVTMALMVLGGDPQMAYHVALLGALYAWLLRRETGSGVDFVTGSSSSTAASVCHEIDSRPLLSPSPPWGEGRGEGQAATHSKQGKTRPLHHILRRVATSRLVLLSSACLIAVGLAAVQILPSWELNALSERAAHDEPRNLYEAAADLVLFDNSEAKEDDRRWQTLLAKPPSDSHAAAAYEFSVGPWRLAEYVWPNAAGREFPVNRRWASVLPAEGRVWVPSFYMGLLPLGLALAAWRVRRADARTRWLSWIVLLAVLGSFGVFGLGRLIREIAVLWNESLVDAQTAAVGDPFGGVYWLMTVLLPGYAQFRFPAKLLVIAGLGLSLLAARGWDDVVSGSPAGRRAGRLLLVFGLTSAVCVAVVAVARSPWMDWLAAAAPGLADPLFGPLDAAGAWSDLCFGFAQAAVVGLAGWWIVRRLTGTSPLAASRNAGRWACAAVILTAIDLGIANRWMIVTAPAEEWHTPSAAAEAIRADTASPDQPFRVDRPDDFDVWPKAWGRESSPSRQRDGLAWDRDTLWPKHALNEPIEMLQASDTSAVLDYELFLASIRRWESTREPVSDDDRHSAGLDALGVRYLILPPGLRPPDDRWQLLRNRSAGTPAAGSSAGRQTAPVLGTDARIWKNPSTLPRAWIVRKIDILPPLTSRRPRDVAARTDEALFRGGQPRDFRTSAVVEAESAAVEAAATFVPPSPLWGESRGEGSETAERCRIVTREPDRVEVDVHITEADALLVLSDLYYPGWRAAVATEGVKLPRAATILRTNRVMRGIALPPGKHRVTFTYRPPSVLWGAAVSGCLWMALLGMVAFILWRRMRRLPVVSGA